MEGRRSMILVNFKTNWKDNFFKWWLSNTKISFFYNDFAYQIANLWGLWLWLLTNLQTCTCRQMSQFWQLLMQNLLFCDLHAFAWRKIVSVEKRGQISRVPSLFFNHLFCSFCSGVFQYLFDYRNCLVIHEWGDPSKGKFTGLFSTLARYRPRCFSTKLWAVSR